MKPLSPSSPCLQGITVAILAGGLGTRIQPVLGAVPKLLAPVAGHPFLAYLLHWLLPHGPEQIVLCLGHGAPLILDYLRQCPSATVPLRTVVEPQPLGTAGALRFAASILGQGPLLILNGDTFVDVDPCHLVARHQAGGAEGSLLCVPMADCRRYGTLTLDNRQRIVQFVEKNPLHTGEGVINAGILLLESSLLADLWRSTGPSLERDFLALLAPGRLQAIPQAAPFIDFGVPESYAQTEAFFTPLSQRMMSA